MVTTADTTGNPARAMGEAAPMTPVVGVIYNPRSHRNQGRDLDIAARANVHIAQPQQREEIDAALRDFRAKGVEFLIVNGGDGTVRDVLTAGMGVFGHDWPTLAVLPKGKTNALNVDLGAPAGWSLAAAVDAWDTGRRMTRRPLLVEPLHGSGPRLAGFIMGAGGYALGVRVGQTAHALGAFDSLAVMASAGFGVLQSVFGSDRNPWRRGVGMDVRLNASREPLDHTGAGYEGRRSILMASTLERFPGGIKLFGALREGLKLAVLDRPSRRVLAMMPLILAGMRLKDPAARGLHYRTADTFELTIDDEYILDGEAFPAGSYRVSQGPALRFVVP